MQKFIYFDGAHSAVFDTGTPSLAAGSGARFEVKMVLIGLVRALNRLLIGKECTAGDIFAANW